VKSRPATLTAPPRPASPGPPPAAPDQHDEPRDRGGVGPEAGLDAYIARLVDQAPPLTSEQRDTLALILRRPHRRPGQPPCPGTPDPVPQRADPFHG
jgi:hypothetical protein